MTVTYLGGGTLGQALPGLASATSQLQGTLAQISTLKANVVSEISKVSSQTGALQGVLAQATSTLNAAQALVDQADLVASSALAVASSVAGNLGTAGVGLYRFDGNIANLGSEIQAALAARGATGTGYAVITVATDGGAITAIQSVFKGS